MCRDSRQRGIRTAVLASALMVSATLLSASCGSTGTDWLGTSPTHSAAYEAAGRLGDAVVAYANGKADLADVKALISPTLIASSAEDGLTQMLSSVGRPDACEAVGTSSYGSSNEIRALLRFTGPDTGQSEFTLTISLTDKTATETTIDEIMPGDTTGQSP
jgi:hypothetical protein